jgi:hypothetical protein
MLWGTHCPMVGQIQSFFVHTFQFCSCAPTVCWSILQCVWMIAQMLAGSMVSNDRCECAHTTMMTVHPHVQNTIQSSPELGHGHKDRPTLGLEKSRALVDTAGVSGQLCCWTKIHSPSAAPQLVCRFGLSLLSYHKDTMLESRQQFRTSSS